MENLAMAPVWSQSGSELLTTLDNLYAAKSLIETYILQATGRLDEMGTAQEFGARDTVELVAQRYRLDPAVVRKDLKFSGALGKYSAVTEALPDPTDPAHPAVLDPALAKVIVTTLEKAPASVPVDVLEVAEEQMVDVARISNPRELAKFGQEVLARLDTDGAEPAEDAALAKETFRLRQVDGGVKFSGFVAGASGELLLTQIHTGAKPHKTIDGERDPRPLDVRQADSFKGVLDAAAGNPDHPGVPHITVTIDFNDLKSDLGVVTEAATTNTPAPAPTGGTSSTGTPSTTDSAKAAGTSAKRSTPSTTAEAGTRNATGATDTTNAIGTADMASPVGMADTTDAVGKAGTSGPVGSPHGVDAVGSLGAIGSLGAVGEMVFGGNLSASAVRLLACDAAILPIVLGGDSQPLDVGTEQRFVNRYIRRALNQRDKGCVVCKAPPWMCHAHHLIHWADGGPTSLHNLALLCAVHHRAVHNDQWAVSITSTGLVEVTRPAWADPPLSDPADLAAVFAWATPAQNDDAPNPSSASTDASADVCVGANASTMSAGVRSTTGSAGVSRADAVEVSDCEESSVASTSDGRAWVDAGVGANISTASAGARFSMAGSGVSRADAGQISDCEGRSGVSTSDGRAGVDAGVGRASVSSNPVHGQPDRLPTASTVPNPELAAAREAFRAHLISMTPNYRDPWGPDTPEAGP
ncbi:DUF222 domain-containing protein [Kribbella sp. NPDC051587]|uniref:HNH endonuclease signature motif containing protein n=1 Tax=Kribbella sp. NPDC051587 TaxID=3364119 RepID=UPI0037900201